MHFAISFLLFVAGWLHGQTGDTYVVSCPPPHTACNVLDISQPRDLSAGAWYRTDGGWTPVFSAAVTPDEVVWPGTDLVVPADAGVWFWPEGE